MEKRDWGLMVPGSQKQGVMFVAVRSCQGRVSLACLERSRCHKHSSTGMKTLHCVNSQ